MSEDTPLILDGPDYEEALEVEISEVDDFGNETVIRRETVGGCAFCGRSKLMGLGRCERCGFRL